jgi:hypothetical protein
MELRSDLQTKKGPNTNYYINFLDELLRKTADLCPIPNTMEFLNGVLETGQASFNAE